MSKSAGLTDPGGVGRRRGGEGVGWDTHDSEKEVLVRGEHRTKAFFYVICCIQVMAPGANEDSSEAGNVSRTRLCYIIETQTRFGTICHHLNLGGRAGCRNNKIVTYEMKLELLPGLVGVDGDEVAVLHLPLDISVHFSSNFRLVRYLYMDSMNPFGSPVMILTQFVQVFGV